MPQSALIIPPPPHHLKLNNKRLNNTNFLKNQTSVPGVVNPTPIANASAALQSGNYSKVAIDNRPKKLIITGVENAQEKTAIINFVKALGCQIESSTDVQKAANDSSNLLSFSISFTTRKDAEIVNFIHFLFLVIIK
jgi:hypothetical protein